MGPDRGPRLPRANRTAWAQLAGASEPPLLFDPARTAALPAPVQRWLAHTLSPGVPLGRRAEIVMTGRIRLGRWRPFTARQIHMTSATASRRPDGGGGRSRSRTAS